jgi:hypothetical protein
MDEHGLRVYQCPDCDYHTAVADDFIDHRLDQHPPRTLTLAPEGIESEERVHGD